MAFLLLVDAPKNSSQLERPDVKSSSDRFASGGGSNDVLVVVRCFGFDVLLLLLLLFEVVLLRSTLGWKGDVDIIASDIGFTDGFAFRCDFVFFAFVGCRGEDSEMMDGMTDAGDGGGGDVCCDAALRLDSAEMAFSFAIDSASLLAMSASNFFLFRSLS